MASFGEDEPQGHIDGVIDDGVDDAVSVVIVLAVVLGIECTVDARVGRIAASQTRDCYDVSIAPVGTDV